MIGLIMMKMTGLEGFKMKTTKKTMTMMKKNGRETSPQLLTFQRLVLEKLNIGIQMTGSGIEILLMLIENSLQL